MLLCEIQFINYVADSDPCVSNPCQNNGICRGGLDYYYCECPTGFAGPTCNRGAYMTCSFFFVYTFA